MHKSLLNGCRHHSKHLQGAWSKYGQEAFDFFVLEFLDSVDRLVEREQYWIDHFNSADPHVGYNIAPKAWSSLGRKHPPEVIALMRITRKGKKKPPFSAEHKAALSASRIGNQWGRGIPKSVEHKAALSAAKLGRKNPAIAESNRRRKGKKIAPCSPEHRAKLSAAWQRRKQCQLASSFGS
jgi:group I intron endonuclease